MQTDGPKGAGTWLASTPSGPEPETCTEETWHWRGWQRDQDGTPKHLIIPLKTPWKKGPFRWKNLVGTNELVCKNVLPPRNIPGRQGDRMLFGPEDYLGSHATLDTRHHASLMPEISDDRGIDAHQDDTLTRQLGERGSQG